MVRLRLKSSKPLSRKIILETKIVIALALIITGIIIIAIGSTNFQKEPNLKKDYYFSAQFEENEEKIVVEFRFTGTYALVPYRGIDSYLAVTFPEVTTNSSKVELLLSNGRVINSDDNPWQAREGKPVKFEFDSITNEGSRYIATPPYLVYYTAGTYGADLKIVLEDNRIIKHGFGSVIELDSWQLYFAEKARNDSLGISWLLIGIAFITVIPGFTKILDWGYERQQLEKTITND